MATGKIKGFQTTLAIVVFSVFPISWVFFKLGFDPTSTYLICIAVYCIAFCTRLYYAKKQLNLSLKFFLKYVIFRTIPVTTLSFASPIPLLINMEDGLTRMIMTSLFSFVTTSLLIYFIGLEKNEHERIKKMIVAKIQNSRNRLKNSLFKISNGKLKE